MPGIPGIELIASARFTFGAPARAHLFAFGHDEMPRDFQGASVDLDQHVVHHARRILFCALRIQTRAVRHRAGLNARHFSHRRRRNDRDRRRHHVAVQVEIHDEKKIAVGRNINRRRKIAERRLAQNAVIFGRVLPDQTKRTAVRDRNIIELPVGRDDDAMRPVDVYRHVAGLQIVIDARALWSEANQGDLVG